MSAPLDVLRALGAEAISHQTHIPIPSVQALLEERFEQFNPIQFSGFVTILEREYDIDLSEWRSRFRGESAAETTPQPGVRDGTENDPFANAARIRRSKQRNMAVVTLLLIIVLAVMAYLLGGSGAREKIELNNTAIDAARENMAVIRTASSSGATESMIAAVQAQIQEESAQSSVEPPVYDDIVIVPRRKIWLGIINAQSHKRKVRSTRAPVSLDGNQSWLIVTGHGLMTLECGGVKAAFSGSDRLLFLYESGKCSQIDEAEFKARNRGRVW